MWSLLLVVSGVFLASAELVDRHPHLVGKINYEVCFRDKDHRTNTTFSCPDVKYPEPVGKYCYPPCPNNTPNYDPDHPQHCYEECKEGYENKGNKCVRPKVVVKVDHAKCPALDPCGKIYRKNYGCAGKCPDSTYKLEHKFGLTGGKCECVRPQKHYYAKHANRPYKKSPGCPEGMTHIHNRKTVPEDLCYKDCPDGKKPMWSKKGLAMCEWVCEKHTNLPYTEKGTCCKDRRACKEWRHGILHDGIQVLKAHKQAKKNPDNKEDQKAMKDAVKQVAKDFLPPKVAPKCSRATDPNAELFDSDPFADLLDADDEIEFEDMVDLRLVLGQGLY